MHYVQIKNNNSAWLQWKWPIRVLARDVWANKRVHDVFNPSSYFYYGTLTLTAPTQNLLNIALYGSP